MLLHWIGCLQEKPWGPSSDHTASGRSSPHAKLHGGRGGSRSTAALRALSDRYGGSLVVLKGHHTLVGQAQGRVTVHLSGNPYLAQEGQGTCWPGGWAACWPNLPYRPMHCEPCAMAFGGYGAAADTLEQEVSGRTPDRLPRGWLDETIGPPWHPTIKDAHRATIAAVMIPAQPDRVARSDWLQAG